MWLVGVKSLIKGFVPWSGYLYPQCAHCCSTQPVCPSPHKSHLSGLGTGLTDLLTFAGLQLTRVNRPKTFDTEPDDMSQGRLAAKKPLYRHLNNLLTITLQGYVAVYTVPHLDPVQVNDKQKRSRVARGCEITNKRVLFPGQGTFTHSVPFSVCR